jgi:hypothetical protein
METPFADQLADHLGMLAAWRRQRSVEEPTDRRHLRSAATLDALAGHVAGLPADDPRLHSLATDLRRGWRLEPGPIFANAVPRFGFYDAPPDPDALVTRMAELAREDRGEAGRDPLRDLPF